MRQSIHNMSPRARNLRRVEFHLSALWPEGRRGRPAGLFPLQLPISLDFIPFALVPLMRISSGAFDTCGPGSTCRPTARPAGRPARKPSAPFSHLHEKWQQKKNRSRAPRLICRHFLLPCCHGYAQPSTSTPPPPPKKKQGGRRSRVY